MYPSAEHIAVVAFQRVLSAETMIAGQLERDIHRLNGVVGDGDFRQIGLDGGKAQRRPCSSRLRLTSSSPAICPTFSCTRGETRERMAETGGHPPRQPPHQPVVSGVGNAVIDRRQQRRLPVGEQAKQFGWAAGGASVGQTSTACSAATRTWLKITSWLPVARIRVIPAFTTLMPGLSPRHQPVPTSGRLSSLLAHRQPAQPLMPGGGINFMAADVPALRATGRHGVRQAARARGASSSSTRRLLMRPPCSTAS